MKALEIVDYFQPNFWFLENPRKGLLRTRDYMKGLSYVDIDYCQVSDWGYQKPTRFWGSAELGLLKPLVCEYRTCVNLHKRQNGWMGHKKILGGTLEPGVQRVPLYDQYRVPPKAIYYLMTGYCNKPFGQHTLTTPTMATPENPVQGNRVTQTPSEGLVGPDPPLPG